MQQLFTNLYLVDQQGLSMLKLRLLRFQLPLNGRTHWRDYSPKTCYV